MVLKLALVFAMLLKSTSFSTLRRARTGSIRQASHVTPFYIAYPPLVRKSLDNDTFTEMHRRRSPKTMYIPVSQGTKVIVKDLGGSKFEEMFLTGAELVVEPEDDTCIYLGQRDDMDFVAVDFAKGRTLPESMKNTVIKLLRDVSEKIEDEDAVAIMSHAVGMTTWHSKTSFCCSCGAPLESRRGGSMKKCTNEDCRASAYPRIEPAVIMMVQSECGQHCLLGRKETWAQGRYSCLAGFLDVGETLEQCVERETFEEAGVLLHEDSVKYIYSQPWPFPSSLMLGYTATARHPHAEVDAEVKAELLPTIDFDPRELSDCKWFSREEVKRALEYSPGSTALNDFTPTAQEIQLHFPGKSSLARRLVRLWVEEGDANDAAPDAEVGK